MDVINDGGLEAQKSNRKISYDVALKLSVVSILLSAMVTIVEEDILGWMRSRWGTGKKQQKQVESKKSKKEETGRQWEENCTYWNGIKFGEIGWVTLGRKLTEVTPADIQWKALEVYQGAYSSQDEFTSGKKWLERFLSRNHLSLQRRTTVVQKLPSDLVAKVTSFIMKAQHTCHSKGFPLSTVGNIDKTP